MARAHSPPHPCEILQDTLLRKDGGITAAEFAKHLGVSRIALSRCRECRTRDSSRRRAPGFSGAIFDREQAFRRSPWLSVEA